MPETQHTGLEPLFQEARAIVRAQERAVETVDEKAANLLRFNTVVVGLIVAATTLLLRGDQPPAIPAVSVIALIGGLAALTTSTAAAILAFRTKQLRTGLKAEHVLKAIDPQPSRESVLRAGTRTYAISVQENARALNRGVRRIELALWMVLAGVLALSLAAMGLLLNNAPRWF